MDFVGCDLADRLRNLVVVIWPIDLRIVFVVIWPIDLRIVLVVISCQRHCSCVSQAGDVTTKWPTCKAWH